jgi:hypothetical protein
MALDFELKNRINGQDTRKIKFKKELELFKLISYDFFEKRKNEIDYTLKNYPSKDD